MRTSQSPWIALQYTTCPNRKISTSYSTKWSKMHKLWRPWLKHQLIAWFKIARPQRLALNMKLQPSSTNLNTLIREKKQCNPPTQIPDSKWAAAIRDQELRITWSPKHSFKMSQEKDNAPRISVTNPKDLIIQSMQNLRLISQSVVLHTSKTCTTKMLTQRMMMLRVSKAPNL